MTTIIDRSEFRNAMSRLGAAVNVITTDGPAGRQGLTASAVCSVTDTPPTVLVCINRSAGAHPHLTANGVLCVNVLSGRHQDLSGAFGRHGLDVAARFAAASWRVVATGSPALTDASVSLDCRIVRTEAIGTHSVFFCEVVGLAMGPDPEGLIYFNRAYHPLADVPT
ncbi:MULTISPECIES: flavin reductase [unclassified Bradyrhizobium]|uniref:flavin reductase n=1 Tax=unclassified Bradyrhizobium TaxID=2631580 RepID=UPI0024468D97|nr:MULTISPECIES: flavin reductase [unclassified Bradyrhizobium]MDH2346144.1 flavin reductase [Bradyrhizobium sp. SSUT77]MDH2350482.1 flavin reductase [Bradyrhizobium sp. SSUT112]